MPPDRSKPNKTTKRQRVTKSDARGARDADPIAQDPHAFAAGPSSRDESHVADMGATRGYTRAVARSVPGPSASTSMFSEAHHFNVGGSIQINSSQCVHNPQAQSIDGLKILLDNIAPNAFYDSRARFDPPKCDEDTRVEVIGELMDWMNDRENPQRLLCITGAAGGGKSALQQTVAERCADSGILGVAFFFSAQDPTRNDLSHIVPTIAFQLGQHDPALQDCIRRAIEKDPIIFTKTIRVQMDTLVVRPFKQLCANGGLNPNNFPHAILIDGLDECSGEEKQAELLSSIKDCLLGGDLPFRIFIASRPEWAIRSALKSDPRGYLHSLAYHIQLSDQYDATKDIRRYLWRRLQAIGYQSHDPRARSHLWPTAADIEKLVRAASGQFVFAATVVKYVSEHRSSPVERLRAVINWTPEVGRLARPFEALDILYTRILIAAKDSYESVDTNRGRNFLLLLRAHQINSDLRVGDKWCASTFHEMLNLEKGTHELVVSDLHSLLVFYPTFVPSRFFDLHFYHRSFSEFLDSETRAKNLFIAEIQVKEYVSKAILQRIDRLSSEPSSNTSEASRSILLGNELDALIYYSHKGEILSGPQILALAQNDGWKKFDYLFPSISSRAILDGHFAEMISILMERLEDELKEPGLADAFQPYYDKWMKEILTRLEEQIDQKEAGSQIPTYCLLDFTPSSP